MPTPKPYRIADLFCGAGGTSTGALQACAELGRPAQLTAVNHWPTAIATHSANHPEAAHLCQSLDSINPRDHFALGELDLLWGSPECMSHSVARGGRPKNDQSRATAWCITRWAEALQPGVIMVENVPEFLDWGPIGTDGKQLVSKKGNTFRAWVGALESLGYRVDHRILCAADYGDPTSRRRLFVQAVRGRREIRWPAPTHFNLRGGHDDLFGALPWRTARDIINWQHPTQSIFSRKRPLSPNTLRRIDIGLRRFGLKPFLVPQQSWHDARSIDRPLPTITGTSTGEMLCEPFLVQANFGARHESRVGSIDDPLKTVLGSNVHALCQPYLVMVSHAGSDEGRAAALDRPLGSVTTRNNVALCEPFIQRVGHYGSGNGLSAIDDPLTTVCTKQEHALVEPFLVKLRGTSPDQIANHSAQPLDRPLPALTAGGGHVALCEPFLTAFYGTATAMSIDDPLDTVTTKERHALVQPTLEIDGERYLLDIHFRMLQPDELALAQGFPADYHFTGNKSQITKQIGNAVPCGLSRALVRAVLNQ